VKFFKKSKTYTKKAYYGVMSAFVVGLVAVQATPAGAEATTSDGTTSSSLFSDMLDLAVDVLPWFVVIMLINALISKVK
jgi:hypothetical protein